MHGPLVIVLKAQRQADLLLGAQGWARSPTLHSHILCQCRPSKSSEPCRLLPFLRHSACGHHTSFAAMHTHVCHALGLPTAYHHACIPVAGTECCHMKSAHSICACQEIVVPDVSVRICLRNLFGCTVHQYFVICTLFAERWGLQAQGVGSRGQILGSHHQHSRPPFLQEGARFFASPHLQSPMYCTKLETYVENFIVKGEFSYRL